MKSEKSIVLLSGGIDSLTCLAIASSKNEDCYGLAVNYGQKHVIEIKAAHRLAKQYRCKDFRVSHIDLGPMPGKSLLDVNQPIPEYTDSISVKNTYLPARNTLFLALALAWAESIGATKIYFGANKADCSGFPDTRPAYIKAFNHLIDTTTQAPKTIQIETPLIDLEKCQIIELGLSLNVDYSGTVTCYQSKEGQKACAVCDSCYIRKQAFTQLGLLDPANFY